MRFESVVQAVPQLRRGIVWCKKCLASQYVDSADCLSKGWPKCCGNTMTIDHPITWRPLSVEDGMSDDVELELSQAVRLEMFLSHECHGTYGDDGEMQCNITPRIDFKRDFPSEILAKAMIHRFIRAAAVPVVQPEERIATELCLREDCDSNHICFNLKGHSGPCYTPIPEERTAEMEQTICQLRELAKNADYLAGASPAAINRLLDHIEGKGN